MNGKFRAYRGIDEADSKCKGGCRQKPRMRGCKEKRKGKGLCGCRRKETD